MMRPQRLEQVIASSDDHRRDGEKEGKFQRGRAVHPGKLAGGDGCHRARRAGEDCRQNLAQSNPHCLANRHLLHIGGQTAASEGFVLRALVHGIDDPHDNSANDQRPGHDVNVFQVLADDLGQQKCRERGADEGNDGQRERMSEHRAITAFALREVAHELNNARPEVNGQAKNRAQLDDDGEHLPVAVGQVEAEKRLANSQVRRRADGKKFSQAFNDAQQDRQQVVVQGVPRVLLWLAITRVRARPRPCRYTLFSIYVSPFQGRHKSRSFGG